MPLTARHGLRKRLCSATRWERRVASIKTAWRLACRRTRLEDLHFHDLRREAGSRWLEGGVPLQTVRDWLGHTNVAQTSTYLASTLQGQHDVMARFEQVRATLQQSATVAVQGVQSGPEDDPTEDSIPGDSIN
ncbi:MAG TPA: tyrosine-type recombinase/integrase [Vicinamibacterales bacterium]|nr:tyrosine-type recombinase/integrase [Vicinamibacterales bacterium]